MSDAYLLAYFLDEHDQEGEAIRFAVSDDQEPYRWTPLSGGAPILRSDVGERGARDPFLVRLRDGGVVVLATDLRIWPGQDWDRTTREGSRSLLVARSSDLTEWSPFELIEVAPSEAGNTWAPKAFWSEGARSWLVFWASALYEQGSDRRGGQHQRILVAPTEDFRTFGQPRVYLDRGRDVIDATFLESEGRWYRFTVDQRVPGGSPDLGHHPSEEIGAALEDPEYVLLADELGKGAIVRGEGPAVATAVDGRRWYLLIDEFGVRGYQLFETTDLSSGHWQHRTDVQMPRGARHGSLLQISSIERDRLLAAFPPTDEIPPVAD